MHCVINYDIIKIKFVHCSFPIKLTFSPRAQIALHPEHWRSGRCEVSCSQLPLSREPDFGGIIYKVTLWTKRKVEHTKSGRQFEVIGGDPCTRKIIDKPLAWDFLNKLQWNLNQYTIIFIEQNMFEGVCEMVAISCWLHCVILPCLLISWLEVDLLAHWPVGLTLGYTVLHKDIFCRQLHLSNQGCLLFLQNLRPMKNVKMSYMISHKIFKGRFS